MKKISGRLANLTPEQREKLLKKLREQKKGELPVSDEGIALDQFRAEGDSFPLSFSQQRLWFLDKLEGQNASYNIPAALKFQGKLDIPALEQALKILVQRHDSLRSIFILEENQPRVKIQPSLDVSIKLNDFSEFDEQRLAREKEKLFREEATGLFNLAKGPLFRFSLLKISETEHMLLVCMHHIISDAWSMQVLLAELSAAYNALVNKEDVGFPVSPRPYVDYAAWKNLQIEKGHYNQQQEYWKTTLANVPVLDFPLDKPRLVEQSYQGDQIVFELVESQTTQLRALAASEQKTLFMILLAAWQVLLYRYAGQKDICSGTPVANREHSSFEGTIGFFVNTLPVRNQVVPDESFVAFLERVKKGVLAAFINPDIPFEKIILDLGIERDMSFSPVFQNMFSFRNDDVEKQLAFNQLETELEPIHTRTSKFDLSLDVVEKDKTLGLSIEFNTDLITRSSANALKSNFLSLIDAVIVDPQQKISSLDCVHQDSFRKQVEIWNDTQREFDSGEDIATRFEKVVEENPEKLALKIGSGTFTYSQLNTGANQMAHLLLEKGVKPGETVAVYLPRNEQSIFALLAALKAGAAYLVLDKESLVTAQEQGIEFLLTERNLVDSADVESGSMQLVFVEDSSQCAKDNPESDKSLEALAFQLFGKNHAKGPLNKIESSQKSFLNLIEWYREQGARLKGNDARYLLDGPLTNLSEQKNVFTPLLNGGRLILAESAHENKEKLLELVEKEKINYLNLSPFRFFSLINNPEDWNRLSGLEFVFLQGEQLFRSSKFSLWLEETRSRVFNCLSHEDCTDICLAFELGRNEGAGVIPFGKPVRNVEAWLLDDNLQLAPVGAKADLYLGGMALGSSHAVQKSNRHFIQNPVPGKKGLLFSTGKKARFLPSGDIVLTGEPAGETAVIPFDENQIREALYKLSEVEYASLFIDRNKGIGEEVNAFIKVDSADSPDRAEIRNRLKQLLPDYLEPDHLVFVRDLPLDKNAVVDRTQLGSALADLETQIALWKEKLAGLSSLQFPEDRAEKATSENCSRKTIPISSALAKKFEKYLPGDETDLQTFLLSVLEVLVFRYCAQEDFAIQGFFPNSRFPWFNQSVNPVLVRSDIEASGTFAELYSRVNESLLEAGSNQSVRIEEVATAILGRHQEQIDEITPLALRVVREEEASEVGYVPEENLSSARLAFYFVEENHGLNFHIDYDSNRYSSEFIEQTGKHFLAIGEYLIENESAAIDAFEYLSPEEKQQILESSEGERLTFESFRNVSEFLDRVLETCPERQALKYFHDEQSCELNYQELHERSDKLAAYLQSLGLASADPVALCLESGPEMVISILACIKAGSPYLPLDPELPEERLAFMLEDSKSQFVLCHNPTRSYLHQANNLINLDDQLVQEKIAEQHNKAVNSAGQDDLFNIIYTSGSTGQPKGVMVTHGGILNRIQWMQHEYQLTPESRVLQKTTYSFDVSVWEFIWPLSVGASLVLTKPGGNKDPIYLSEIIRDEAISHCHFVPSMLVSWLETVSEFSLTSLRKVFCSGEALSRDAVNHFYSNFPYCELHNLYGPTEAAIDVSYWHCEKQLDNAYSVPIGKPVANTTLHVLDKNRKLVPPGVMGELYIGGVQLARGYLNREELTRETFVEIAPDNHDPLRFYKTGDLVRLNGEGVIEYLGRSDHQVKVRGYRIELGEIENCLQSMDELSLSVVKAVEVHGSTRLLAYISLRDIKAGELDAGQKKEYEKSIKHYLANNLPAYMMPAFFIFLNELPLLKNGKINRKALPELDLASLGGSEYLEADSDLESQLQQIWQTVLGIENIGTRDNFFELGGDSILSIQIISAARSKNIYLTPNQIFRFPTIAELAQVASVDQGGVAAEQGRIEGEYPCAPVQNWFFSHFYRAETNAVNHFNQSVLLDLENEISEDVLLSMVSVLLEKHDVLNLRFFQKGNDWHQVHGEKPAPEKLISASSFDLHAPAQEEQSLEYNLLQAQNSIDIKNGELIHFRALECLKSGQMSHSLYIVAHHLVVDGVSWRILLNDLDEMIEQYLTNETLDRNALEVLFREKLPDKTLSFKQWSQSLSSLYQDKLMAEDRAYWQALDEKLASHQSPFLSDKTVQESHYGDQERLSFSLPKAITDKFLKKANLPFGTEPNDILLCAFHEAITENQDQQSLLVNMEMHGRDLNDALLEHLGMPDVSRTLGWFTSMFPILINDESESGEWAEKLKALKETIRNVPNKGLGFGLQAQTYGDIPWQEFKPDISFNYLGQVGKDFNKKHFSLNSQLVREKKMVAIDQSPDLPLAHLVDVLVFIEDGCINCDLLYDSKNLEQESVNALLDKYRSKLVELITFCAGQHRKYLSPSDLKAAHLEQKEIEVLENMVENIGESEEFKARPLSLETIHDLLPTQKGMLFHSIFSGKEVSQEEYIEQFCVELEGELKIESLQSAWQSTVEKHPVLRSFFDWQFGDALQLVLSSLAVEIESHHFDNDVDSSKQLGLFLEQDKQRGFDLSRPPLLRLSMLHFGKNNFWLVWSYHHILLDGWSVPLVLEDLFRNYQEIESGQLKTKPALSSNLFESYVAWFEQQDDASAYWKKTLSGFNAANEIDLEPLSDPIVAENREADNVVSLSLEPRMSEALRFFCRKNQLTLNTLVQGAWAMLLAQYSGDEDIVFGVTVSGRPSEFPDADKIVGMFINTLPMRLKLTEYPDLLSLLQGIQAMQQELNQYQNSALVDIQKQCGFGQDNPLFNSILVFENFPVDERLKQQNEWFSIGDIFSQEKTNYPLSISVEPAQEIGLRVLFDTGLYRRKTIERVLGHLSCILSNFAGSESSDVFSLPFITEKEREALDEWNKNSTSYPRESNLSVLVEQKAAQLPDHPALKFNESSISYKELDKQANQLARFLNEKGVAKGDRVVLFMDRSEAFLISVLAVVRAGAAYVPLDPAYPVERLQYMLEDCEPSLILSLSADKTSLHQVLQDSGVSELDEKIACFDESMSYWQSLEVSNPGYDKDINANDLLYLMYTSGSTGQPKGVCISHRSVIRLVVNNWFVSIGVNDRIGHVSNVCFDASTYEIWGALLNGATMIGFDRETLLSDDLFAEKLQSEAVTNMFMTAALFHMYSHHRPEIFSKMRCLLVGGEPVQVEPVRRIQKEIPQLRLMNGYGPTENTVFTCVFDMLNLTASAKNIPVGKPVSNSTAYVVNKRFQELPVGVIGELVSGGDGVGLGYWHKDDLSKKVFVENPFATGPGETIYRTGDLARRLEDGNIEVIGRMDDQIKVKGFRIEPGEIVKILKELESVDYAVVTNVSSENHISQLVAYIVVKEGKVFDSGEAKDLLKESLPAHMIPGFFIEIDSIPLTANGKLDKASLPKPRQGELVRDNYAAARNEVEAALVNIWQDILKISSIGVFDNFFELGGDSIISIQIVSRAKRSGLDISPRLLFEHPTISELAAHASNAVSKVVAEQGLVKGEVTLTPVQHWFFEKELSDVNHFNQSLLFKVNDFLTVQSITPVLSALVKFHDIFRLRYSKLNDEWVQKHDNSSRSLSSLVDILSEVNLASEKDPYQRMLLHSREQQSKINLEKGPLLKMVLYHLGESGQRLLIIAHHLVVDGVSWRILLDDLNLAFEQQRDNRAIDFGRKSSSFQFYSSCLLEYAKDRRLDYARNYWETKLASLDREKIFTRDSSGQENSSDENKPGKLSFTLNKNSSRDLFIESNKAYRTEVQDLVLLAFAMALKESNLCEHIYLDLETHGRDCFSGEFEEKVDLSHTVGWFTTIFPLLMNFDEQALAEENISTLIKSVKTDIRGIPDHGATFMALKYLDKDSSLQAILKGLPAPEISFNYLGQITETESENTLEVDLEYMQQDIQDNSPNNKMTHALSLAASMRAGQFNFDLNYDTGVFDQETIEGLRDSMADKLQKIVEYCLDENHFGFTPNDMPYYDLEQGQLDQICENHRSRKLGKLDAIYPLSPMQEGMLFHSRLDVHSGMYCEQVSVLFEGELNIVAMERAWNEAVAGHDILRTSFIWENLPRPLQLVQDAARIKIQVQDWRGERSPDKKLNAFLAADRSEGFDFSDAPLMRLHYILLPDNLGAAQGRFIWTYHHILLDGWSMPLLMREIFDRYNAYQKKQNTSSGSLEQEASELIANAGSQGGYQQYIEWLYRNSLTGTKLSDADTPGEQDSVENFWHSYLAGFEEANNLGINKLSLAKTDSDEHEALPRYLELGCMLDEEQTRTLQAFASNHQVTVNTLLQAAWALLLNRYSGQQDIVFGMTVSGRPSELHNVESIIGLFINTVPFRVRVDADAMLDDWLKQIFKNQIQLRQYETTPLVEIQAQSEIDGSRALFDSILVFENYPLDETLQHSPEGLEVRDLKVFEQTNFPLSLIILPGTSLEIRMLYDSQLYEGKAINQVLQHLKAMLLGFIEIKESYNKKLQEIDYFSEGERQKIIEEWNDTDSDYPRDDYLKDIVSRQSSADIALISDEGNLSYQELDRKSSCLANHIRSKHLGAHAVKPGDKVIICMNRSNELIVSMLAILKAGGVYVPLDPGYPEERQRYMLEDTQARLILTDTGNAPLVKHLCSNKALGNSVSYLDLIADMKIIDQSNGELESFLPPYIENQDVPAAILYTSGSTGQPKGVCLTHRGLARMVMNTNYMHLTPDDRVAHVSNICFDAASFEVWAALLNGLPLVILEKDIMLDLHKFERALKDSRVSILLITTALFNLVAKERVSALENIRYLFFGGEASNALMVKRVLEEASPEHLMHMYGPSENSTYATWYEVKSVDEHAKSIPIGKAVSNSQVYIMNQQGDLLPPGVAGEIVCAGDGLALGYLNKPEQTRKAFVMRSLPGRPEQRMYLTGDLGVCLPDGNIEILGRIDNQVKIRGHRIEPEEIIARINALPQVKKAHVLVKQDKEDKKYLVAYYVPEPEWTTEQKDKHARSRELKLALKAVMPDYMVPGFYVEIQELPLTPNGKIDTKALPDADQLHTASEYQAPESELEKQLVAIWEEVLGHEKIGVNDDFFELGGHSLLATQIHSRIRQQLGIDIPLRTLFELPSIREFSEFWQAISSTHGSQDIEDDSDEEFEEGEL